MMRAMNITTELLVGPQTEVSSTTLALDTVIAYWIEAVCDPSSPRRHDLMRMKRAAVQGFFTWIGKGIDEVGADDIRAWRLALEKKGLQATTIYSRLSFVSSFYEWVLKEPLLASRIRFNPVRLARPKAPKPYQSRSVKALTDEELNALHAIIQAQTNPTSLIGLRDYALFLLFITSGLRRHELLSLRGCDVEISGDGLQLTTRIKGGYYSTRKLDEPAVKDALVAYLRQSKRLSIITRNDEDPLWLRHDRGAAAHEKNHALAAWSFARQMKTYAKAAGLTKRFHLHQLRHTFARIVAEEAQSLPEVQDALEHRNPATTRIYVQRIGVKRDKFSRLINSRLQPKAASKG